MQPPPGPQHTSRGYHSASNGPRHQHQAYTPLLRGPKANPSHAVIPFRPAVAVTEYNRVDTDLKNGIMDTYRIWRSGNNRKAFEIWHITLKDIDKNSIPMVMQLVFELLGNKPDYGEFEFLLSRNLPARLLQASMPEPSHAAICALLESMHNRLAKLELSAAFKTKSII